jgi:hypothetical protein
MAFGALFKLIGIPNSSVSSVLVISSPTLKNADSTKTPFTA